MAAERFTPRDETDEGLADEFRGGKRDWRRWWESKAEAFDPEKWKAMASVWSGLLQDAAKEAQGRARVEHGDQDLSRTVPRRSSRRQSSANTAPPGWPQSRRRPATSLFRVRAQWTPAFRKGYDSPRLTRSTADAMAAGVLSGVGHFFGVDPTWLRIAYALGTIFTAIVPGIAVYAILALIIPGNDPASGPGLE